MRPLLRGIAAAAVALAACQALAAGVAWFEAAISQRMGDGLLAFLGWTTAASIGGSALAGALAGAPRVERVGTGLAALLAVAGLWVVRAEAEIARPRRDPVRFERGRWPHEAGAVVEVARAGQGAPTTILPDGTRPCGPQPEAGPTVVLVGDSFVFGLGVSDPDTLCWRLREVAAADGTPIRAVNLGQPGAGLTTYARAVRYAVDTFDPDVIVLSVLPYDDTRVLDVNDLSELYRSDRFRRGAALLGPEVALNAGATFLEVFPNDFYLETVLPGLLDEVARAAGDTPLVVEALQALLLPGTEFVSYRIERIVEAFAARHPHVTLVPIFHAPAVLDGQPLIVPGDGHPGPYGNQLRAEKAWPVVAATLGGTP